MKILFVVQSCLPFNATTLNERPIGGTETGVIRLADELVKLGHTVIVCNDDPNPPLSYPLYLPKKALSDVGPVDVLVAVREWTPLLAPLKADVKLMWTGDSYDQIQNVGIGDPRIYRQMNALLCVSEWHAKTLSDHSGLPKEKCRILRNGIKLDYFDGAEPRSRKRLVYSSAPYRGLKHLVDIFPRILKTHPDSELHIFSGFEVYKAGDEQYEKRAEVEFAQVRGELEKIRNVHLHGNIKQGQLAREFMKSSILAYPNTFEETSCITAMEVQAAGCVTVTSSKGALPETVGDSGIIVPGDPGTAEFNGQFADSINNLLSDQESWERLSIIAMRNSRALDWSNRAKEFMATISEVAQSSS